MRSLLGLVVAMGMLIVAGVAVVGVTIVHRLAGAAPVPASLIDTLLQEPSGTRIAGVSGFDRKLAIVLQGGGPDRVVVYDLGAARTVAKISVGAAPGLASPP